MRIRNHGMFALMLASGLAAAAVAQSTTPPASTTPEVKPADPTAKPAEGATSRSTNITAGATTTVHPGAATLSRMMRVVSADFTDNTIEQCLNYVRDVAGVEIEPLWSESGAEGLDREKTITISAKNTTMLALLEKILDKAAGDISGMGASWQMTEGGSLQVGLKSSLNKFRRMEMYDISDLLFEVRDKTNIPTLDMQQAFQAAGQGGGGGGGRSPFTNTNNNQPRTGADSAQRREEMVRQLKTLITSLVEQDQWADNGGEGGTITSWQGTFLVNAPDYMHRQINGYPYWDSSRTTAKQGRGGRYVQLDADVQRTSYDSFRTVPVSGAAAPGR